MKKIVLLNSSPHKNSVSATICDAFLSAAHDMEIKAYNAYDLAAKPCYACGFCKHNKGCCAFDDLAEFHRDFEQADYFIISTPIFNTSVPSPLKAIIDRFQPYFELRFTHGIKPPIEKAKKAALIMSAGNAEETCEAIEKMLRRQFTVLNTQLKETVLFSGTDSLAPSESFLEEAKTEGVFFFS